MDLQPTRDRVLVQRIKPKDEGLIVSPEIAEHELGKLEEGLTGAPMCLGIVLAVGPGKRNEDGDFIPTVVKVGDIVYFNGRWNDWEGSPHEQALIREADIGCKVEQPHVVTHNNEVARSGVTVRAVCEWSGSPPIRTRA